MDPLLITIIALAVIVGISFALGRGVLAERRVAFSAVEPISADLLPLLGPLNAACRGDAIVWPAGSLAEIIAATTGEKPSESWQQKLEAAGIDLLLIHTTTGKAIAAIRMIDDPAAAEHDEEKAEEDAEPDDFIPAVVIRHSADPLVEKVLHPVGVQLLEISWSEEYDAADLHRVVRPLFKAAKDALRKSA